MPFLWPLGCLVGGLLATLLVALPALLAILVLLTLPASRAPAWLLLAAVPGVLVLLLAVGALISLRHLGRRFSDMSRRLEAAEARRRSFLADVTHELRTPLTVIRGQAEAIADGVYPGDAEHLEAILEATHTLELLTEDLRTLALSEAGALTLAREPVDLAVLISDAAGAFQPAAEAAGVRISSEVSAELPPVEADPARLRGVLQNLLSNALRHTPKGGSIVISAEADSRRVLVSVRDDGTGISPELLPRIFDRFVKAPGSPGSGLGLAIARDVVEAHGGRIEAASRPGNTTFRFTIPREAPG